MNTTPLHFVIGFVGITVLAGLAGIIVLSANAQPIPDVLQNVTVGALTGLVGLLVPSGSASG